MAVLAGSYETYTTEGDREDLADIIYNIDPVETPFMSSINRGTSSAITHEWQTDNLDTAAFNAVVESNDSTFSAPQETLRPQNICQISEKTVAISGTLEAIDKAGRKSEVSYQLARMGKSLKRDCEFTLTQNQAPAGGSSGVARTLASYECWITGTNASRDATSGADATFDGTSAYPTAAPTDSSADRPLLESMLKNVIQSVWTAGGDPSLIIAGPFNKQVISSFSGNSTRFDKGEDKRLVTAIDVYVSDFGDHRCVPNRFSREQSVLVVTPSLWSTDYLRPFRQHPLAKTGDSEKRLINVEFTLRSSNKAGSGVVADLTTS